MQMKTQAKERSKMLDPSADLVNEEELYIKVEKKLRTLKEESDQCQDLVNSVDVKKNQAIQVTMTSVAANFRRMFKTFVPEGRGYLKWVLKGKNEDEDEDDSNEDDDVITRRF